MCSRAPTELLRTRACWTHSVTSACVIRPIQAAISYRARARPSWCSRTIFWNSRSIRSRLSQPMSGSMANALIHGGIYQARPDVNAVCHHHAPSILPFCISGMDLKPVYHLGATLGEKVPFWDARDDFGDTNLIVAKPEEGASLARALGENWIVLMRRHGATVAGISLEELTFRTIYTARNAALQIQAHMLGLVSPLNPTETRLAGEYNLRPGPVMRAWEYWNARLDKVEGGRASGAQARAKKVFVQTMNKTSPLRARVTCGQRHACTQDSLRARGCGEISGLLVCSTLETRRARRPTSGSRQPLLWDATSAPHA